jgi:hypothetical protein
MNVITPAQSELIAADIRKQAELLDAVARDFEPPWGSAAKARMLRLRSERLPVALPIPGFSSSCRNGAILLTEPAPIGAGSDAPER